MDVSLVYIESPANPTNSIVDISKSKELADYFSRKENKVYLAIDNTFMGPVFSQPIDHGADVVLYSATKYIGGHSDLVAGAVLDGMQAELTQAGIDLGENTEVPAEEVLEEETTTQKDGE